MLRDHVPMKYRRRLARARVQARRPTSSLRRLPEFVVIGVQRGGTSSLFRYLNAHPEVRRPLRKEIDYFSVDYGRGESWYRSHFPLRSAEQRSYDCTPQYFVHPLAPERCHKLLPDVRLVVSVRDPIERAISQYHHMRSLGFESLDLLDALRAEPERIADDLAAVMADDRHRPTTYLRFNYVERSRYGAQMSRWLDWYGLSSIHFFDFERFTADPEPEWRSLLRFLGLRPWDPPDFRNWTPTDARPAPDGEAISFLRAELAEDAAKFQEMVGREFRWPLLQ